MDVNVMVATRRTQAERTAATRGALVAAARTLFAAHGYAEVGTARVAQAAGVTRGALYHQFKDKADLFVAVLEAVELDVTGRLVDALAAVAPDDAAAVLATGADAWLDICADPEVQRIVMLDGPAVLGWERWREVGMRHGVGLTSALLTELMDAGGIPRQPVAPLAHVLMGALDEAALYIARADDPERARAEAGEVVQRLLGALISPPT